MSVYGYNRRTTPNLESLASEGAVFEYAFSNSPWTKPSTASFMTSLHHSVLGGYNNDADPLPDQAVTMAQHFHEADYQTGVFVANDSPFTTLIPIRKAVNDPGPCAIANASISCIGVLVVCNKCSIAGKSISE